MEIPPIPSLGISFNVDLEVLYDPFKGRTGYEVAKLLEESLKDVLYELSPDVTYAQTLITEVEEFNND